MTLGIFGKGSTIAHAVATLARGRDGGEKVIDEKVPDDLDRYFFAAGFLAGSPIRMQSDDDLFNTFAANFAAVVARIDRIIDVNDRARIVVMGSYSGIAGSFDMAYAGSKAALHLYIETKKLRAPGQQLVGIAPTIIWDTGMTQRRDDLEETKIRGKARRRQRWLMAEEVARIVDFILYCDTGSLSNVVIPMTGGNW